MLYSCKDAHIAKLTGAFGLKITGQYMRMDVPCKRRLLAD